MTRNLRWGVLGTGGIAAQFVADLRLLDGAEAVAVGSRRLETAEAFGERTGIARRHRSYEALVEDPEVDVVYVATVNSEHHANALMAIRAGKPVLVEKPFTLNAGEAREIVDEARATGVFCMEAMWTRFLPHVVAIRELLARGALGDVRTVLAEHGQRLDDVPRLHEPALGGGALLDLGVYPVSFASMVLGRPTSVTAVGEPTAGGVDAQTSLVLRYPGGRQAVLHCSLSAAGRNGAVIVGTEARLEVDPVFLVPTSFRVVARDGRVERHEHPHAGNGLRHEAAEVARCLREGLLESPSLPLAETIEVMETLDEARRQIGLRFPQENERAGMEGTSAR